MEAAALIALLGAYRIFVGAASNRALLGISAVVLVMAIGRYMEVTAPALFGRRINLYWDVQFIPDVAAMIAQSAPTYLVMLVVVAVPLALGVVFAAIYWSLRQIRRTFERESAARGTTAAMLAVAAVYFFGYFDVLPTLRLYSIPLHRTYAQQLEFVRIALNEETAMQGVPDRSPLESIAPSPLPDGDMLLTFVESYGATAYDNEIVDASLQEPRREFARAVDATDRQILTAFFEAPTFGGASWLSHASVMTALHIGSNAAHNVLLTQDRPTVAKLLHNAGYRTLAVMPGLKNNWPEGSFYGFDQIYDASRLAWNGPAFGWWRIPDQYALAAVHERELSRSDRAPVFVFFATISTHMPFRPTPPYQPQWQRITSGVPFTDDELGDRLQQLPDYTNLAPAYAGSLEYTFAYWAGYLEDHPDRDFLLVLLGDHQPPASVSGEGARWDVPVHVVTRDGALIDRLQSAGFALGLDPPGASVAALHELPLLLLQR